MADMTRTKKVVLGCLAVPLVLVAVALLLSGVVFLWPTPEPRPVELTLGASPTAGERAVAEVPQVDVELSEGEFHILAAEGDTCRAEGSFDGSAYALEVKELAPGHMLVRFHRTLGPLASLARLRLAGHGGRQMQNRVTVYLPTTYPIALRLRIRQGESKTDLTRVRLRKLDLDLAMGQHEVGFREPNPEPLERLVAKTRMGEFELSGLGYAGAREIEVSSTMGEHRIDFAGQLTAPAAAKFKLRMGELSVRVPAAMDVATKPAAVVMGSFQTLRASAGSSGPVVERSERAGEESTPTATLTLAFDVMMGEATLR